VFTETWEFISVSFGTLDLPRQPRITRLTHSISSLISRSTNLDSWTLSQLRIMKVGGNASASEYFNRYGGSSLLTSSDAKSRYSSSVAEKYKAELEKRKRDDEFKFPEGIKIEGVDLNKAVPGSGSGVNSRTSTPVPNGAKDAAGGDDDFFSTWDKPSAPVSKPATPQPGAARPPGIGAARPPSTGPRTVTSSSLRAGATSGSASTGTTTTKAPSRLGATRLSSNLATSTTSTTSNPGAPRASKLGAKRAAAPINFEEAQRKALEEEERIKRLGYDRKKEEDEAREREKREAEARATNKASSSGYDTARSSTPVRGAVAEKPKPVRLGFGATAATAGAAAVAAGSAAATKT
jgi:ADP-ribosylation factor GTPase-activating protein 2/3